VQLVFIKNQVNVSKIHTRKKDDSKKFDNGTSSLCLKQERLKELESCDIQFISQFHKKITRLSFALEMAF
jgi:hypothetical protein